MREIKFRGKRRKGGAWAFGLLGMGISGAVDEISGFGNSEHPNQYNTYRVHIETIGQFTGLKDKNGKDVYDGDINKWYTLNSSNLSSLYGPDETVNYSVMTWIDEWKMWGWLMIDEYADYLEKGSQCLDETMFWTYNAGNEDPILICGNIHDNPELIK